MIYWLTYMKINDTVVSGIAGSGCSMSVWIMLLSDLCHPLCWSHYQVRSSCVNPREPSSAPDLHSYHPNYLKPKGTCFSIHSSQSAGVVSHWVKLGHMPEPEPILWFVEWITLIVQTQVTWLPQNLGSVIHKSYWQRVEMTFPLKVMDMLFLRR